MSGPGLLARAARLVADVGRVPTAQRAVLGYYAATGTFDARALGLKSEVDSAMDDILTELYGACERAVAQELDVDERDVSFSYETKLTLPAELTLGYLFRRARQRSTPTYDPVTDEVSEGLVGPLPGVTGRPDGTARRQHANREARALVEDAREMTAFVVAALLDGDMRDAINDEEFEDFLVTVEGRAPETDSKTVAEVVQSCLQSRVERGFESYPDGVRDAYDHAVDVSEAHQAQDERFRELMATAAERENDAGEEARAAIETEYKHRPMADDDHPFTREELALPYLTTQYDRVGVIYHGMLEMYRAAGFEIEPAFERSIVFAIIGAQVWLDDVDDYHDDSAEGQLTPVTAEYLLDSGEREAFETIVSVSNTYFDHARAYADAADSTLTGIAVEYILYSGDVSHLPGSEG